MTQMTFSDAEDAGNVSETAFTEVRMLGIRSSR